MAEYTPSEADVRAWCREGTGDYPDVMDEWITRFLARVRRDALAAAEHRATRAEAERDRWHSMWRQRGIKHLAAKKRATRAEARADIRGRAVVIYRERAREAEARIRAVEDVLDSIDTSAEPALHDGFADIHRDQMQENT